MYQDPATLSGLSRSLTTYLVDYIQSQPRAELHQEFSGVGCATVTVVAIVSMATT